MIQQRTPNHLLGRIMAFTSAVTMCVQPVGQMVYGFLFDEFCGAVSLILIPTGIIVCMIGLLCRDFFVKLDKDVKNRQKDTGKTE